MSGTQSDEDTASDSDVAQLQRPRPAAQPAQAAAQAAQAPARPLNLPILPNLPPQARPAAQPAAQPPAQPAAQPAAQAPAQAAPARGNAAPARPVNDSDEQSRNRRWSVWAKKTFHLPDANGQNQILASAIATAARIDESTLQPGKAATLAGTPLTANDPLFAAFVTELAAYEALALPREEPQSKPLLAAATAARAAAANDPAKLAPIDETLAALKAFELRNKIVHAGTPPWSAKDAPRATAAKVELDMLSLGPNRTLTPQGGGVNPSYWVERSANDGAKDKKSFLCKPPGGTVPGIPRDGEVAREALAGQAASALKGAMKLDLDMPETHVISMPASAFPTAPRGTTPDGQVPCSVQEAKNVKGDFNSASAADRDAIPASQCAAVAFLDLAMLNTDRHGGNIMIGQDGGLVPIDHGCAFPSTDAPGRERMRGLISGPHNALLQLPGTHEPMTEEMAAGLRALDPAALNKQLKDGAAAIGQDNPAMAGLVDQASLDASLASTRFLKLSAGIDSGKKKNKQRLSPAAVQVAFAANLDDLLAFPPPTDDKTAKPFDKRAREILKQALADQPLTAQACLLEDTAYLKVSEKLNALKWWVALRVDAPTAGVSGDPVLCAKLLAGKIRNPLPIATPKTLNTAKNQLAFARKLVAKVKAKDVASSLVECQMEAIQETIALLPAQAKATAVQRLTQGRTALMADAKARRVFLQQVEEQARQTLLAEWAAFQAAYDLGPNQNFGFTLNQIEGGMPRGDYKGAKAGIDEMFGYARAGHVNIIPKNAPPQGNANV